MGECRPRLDSMHMHFGTKTIATVRVHVWMYEMLSLTRTSFSSPWEDRCEGNCM